MLLNGLDWGILVVFFVVSLLIGLYSSRTAGKSAQEFFLSGRNMPWWLLGVSMVATTFAADTPMLVTDIVRQNGVSGNWAWWAFLLTGMLTVFVYARLWRRSGVMTDIEFYEMRYSGKMAAFLRGFRAVYLGLFFNVMIMATVCLAVIKIMAVMLQWPAWLTLAAGMTVTAFYSTLGGLRGILLTDFFLFIISMIGSAGAAIFILDLPEVGGLQQLTSHPEVVGKLSLLPDFSQTDQLVTVLILPLAVQWWSVWYPGAEPGGGGYIAQRMLSARSEKGAISATLFFNAAHYALRPWPWIIVALASIVVFPTAASMQQAFPGVDSALILEDFAYPAMLSYLPHGLLGLVVTSLIAAFMSTISTQVNWGASYLVNDFYLRFVKPDATEKQLVNAGRVSTILLLLVASLMALLLSNALQAFSILLQIGAGTGLIFILRWFWWRINAWSELSAMVISFLVAIYLEIVHLQLGFEAMSTATKLLTGVGITTVGWLLVTFLTPPTPMFRLIEFYQRVHPGGKGWKPVTDQALATGQLPNRPELLKSNLPEGILNMLIGCVAVYSALFATGYWIYGRTTGAAILTTVFGISVWLLMRSWAKLRTF